MIAQADSRADSAASRRSAVSRARSPVGGGRVSSEDADAGTHAPRRRVPRRVSETPPLGTRRGLSPSAHRTATRIATRVPRRRDEGKKARAVARIVRLELQRDREFIEELKARATKRIEKLRLAEIAQEYERRQRRDDEPGPGGHRQKYRANTHERDRVAREQVPERSAGTQGHRPERHHAAAAIIRNGELQSRLPGREVQNQAESGRGAARAPRIPAASLATPPAIPACRPAAPTPETSRAAPACRTSRWQARLRARLRPAR